MAIRNGRADPLRDGGGGTPMGCSRGLRLPARRPAGPDGVVLKVRPGLDMLASQHGIQLRPDPVVIRTTAIIDTGGSEGSTARLRSPPHDHGAAVASYPP